MGRESGASGTEMTNTMCRESQRTQFWLRSQEEAKRTLSRQLHGTLSTPPTPHTPAAPLTR